KDQKPKSHDEKTGEKPKDDHKHEPHHDEKDVKKTVKINHESHHIVAKGDKTHGGSEASQPCDDAKDGRLDDMRARSEIEDGVHIPRKVCPVSAVGFGDCKAFRVLSVLSDVPFNTGIVFDKQCDDCRSSRIRGTVSVQSPYFSRRGFSGNFGEKFRAFLTYQIISSLGEQSQAIEEVEVTSVCYNTKTCNSVTVEFTIQCDPKQNELIRSALNEAVLGKKV
ncbi:unnamed protein product, partial [Didymodactylos carnosus]